MSKGIFIIGTDTNIGKTLVSAGLMHILNSNSLNACYFKPIISGGFKFGRGLIPLDTVFVKAVAHLKESSVSLSSYIFKTPVSPHLAARLEAKCIKICKIKDRLNYIKSKYNYIIAEGCGGLAVPLDDDGFMLYDLIKELGFSCILVAGAHVGTINHIFLTLELAKVKGIKVKGIIINNYTGESHERDSIETIKKITGAKILGIIPKISGVDMEKLKYSNLKKVFEEAINLKDIIETFENIG